MPKHSHLSLFHLVPKIRAIFMDVQRLTLYLFVRATKELPYSVVQEFVNGRPLLEPVRSMSWRFEIGQSDTCALETQHGSPIFIQLLRLFVMFHRRYLYDQSFSEHRCFLSRDAYEIPCVQFCVVNQSSKTSLGGQIL